MVIHTVTSGETVESVARLYNIPLHSIISANNVINPEAVTEGSGLIIPVRVSSHPPLRKGHKGISVTELQQRMTALGYRPGTVNGLFNKATAIAVKRFQKSQGLSPDGVVGQKTWDALVNAANMESEYEPDEEVGTGRNLGLDSRKQSSAPLTPVIPTPDNDSFRDRKETEGVVFSPPLFDGRIFLGNDSGVLYCFDSAGGRQMWTAAAEGAIRSEAAADSRRVFVIDETQKLYAFDKKTGQLSWTAPVAPVHEPISPGACGVAKPVVAGDTVMAVPVNGRDDAGRLMVFEAETGKILLQVAFRDKREKYIRGYRLPSTSDR